MVNKIFCDYCGLEIKEQEAIENRQYNYNGIVSDACIKCSSKIKKINSKYQVTFESLQKKKEIEIENINKPKVKTNKWWEFWK